MEWDAYGMHFHLLNLSVQEEPPGSLPNDMVLIRRWLRNPSDDVWRRVQPQVFSAWTLRGDRWFNAGMVETCERRSNYLHRYETGTKLVRESPEILRKRSSKEVDFDVGSKKLKSKSTRIPEEFMPKDEHYSLAAELGIDCEGEFQKFRDYYLGTSGSKAVKCDWDATFRNWLRNSLNYGGRANGREPTKAQQRAINTRQNILIALGDIPAPGAGRAGVSVGDPTGPDEGLAELLPSRKTRTHKGGV